MSIQTATKIAIAGIALGLIMSLATPFAPWLWFTTREQARQMMAFYQITKAVLLYGGLLVFLSVLASKQKGQS